MTDDVKHLLGGYATGTLTPAENEALMRAALEDQELFNALADDEVLRRYLGDPAFRQDLLKATARRQVRAWWYAGASAAAAACLFATFLWTSHRSETPLEMALSKAVPSPPAMAPLAESAPAKAAPRLKTTPGPAIARAMAKSEGSVAPRAFAPPAPVAGAPQVGADLASPAVAEPAPAMAPRIARQAMAVAKPLINAQITDINAAILTVDAGSNVGVKAGDHLTILHDGNPIGEIVITTVEPAFSVGRFTGTTPPRIGDIAATPKK
jgi:hypothetical protein